jgi:hypothetical protein
MLAVIALKRVVMITLNLKNLQPNLTQAILPLKINIFVF